MKLRQFLIGLATLMVVACKPTVSTTSAIISQAGDRGTSLILMRNLYAPGQVAKSDAAAIVIERALRLHLGLVQCTGADAATRIGFLEALSFRNPDAVRRQGKQVFIATTNTSERYEGCEVIGAHTMNAAALIAGVGAPQTDNLLQEQTIWLALRGRAGVTSKTFSLQIWRFLEEQLGATPAATYGFTSQQIAADDGRLNPCLGGNQKYYVCDLQTKNYRPTGDYRNGVTLLTEHIDRYESNHLAQLKSSDQTGLEWVGASLATRTDLSLSADLDRLIKAVQKAPANAGLALTQGVSQNLTGKEIQVLKAKAGQFAQRYRIQLGERPSPVYSFSNPKVSQTPPALQDQRIASAQIGKWVKSSARPDMFVRKPTSSQHWETKVVHQSGLSRPYEEVRQWLPIDSGTQGTLRWKLAQNERSEFRIDPESGLVSREVRNVDFYPGDAYRQHLATAATSSSPGVKVEPEPFSFENLFGGLALLEDRVHSKSEYQQTLGWTQARFGDMSASQFINQRGQTLPNVAHFTSGAYQAQYRMGERDFDEEKYNGDRFNCQDFTAAEVAAYYEMTGLRARAAFFTFDNDHDQDVSGASAEQSRVAHAVAALPVGTNSDGQRLWVLREPQRGPGESSVSEPFVWADRASAYAKFSGHGNVNIYQNSPTNSYREFDPAVGASSVVYDELSSRESTYRGVKRENGEGGNQFVTGLDGKVHTNWDFDPFRGNEEAYERLVKEREAHAFAEASRAETKTFEDATKKGHEERQAQSQQTASSQRDMSMFSGCRSCPNSCQPINSYPYYGCSQSTSEGNWYSNAGGRSQGGQDRQQSDQRQTSQGGHSNGGQYNQASSGGASRSRANKSYGTPTGCSSCPDSCQSINSYPYYGCRKQAPANEVINPYKQSVPTYLGSTQTSVYSSQPSAESVYSGPALNSTKPSDNPSNQVVYQ